MFTEELQRMMKDDAQPRHLDLVDMVKFVHKYSSRPEEWAPEIRDVLILKVRRFTGIFQTFNFLMLVNEMLRAIIFSLSHILSGT